MITTPSVVVIELENVPLPNTAANFVLDILSGAPTVGAAQEEKLM
jgi:hypothetical protein